MSDATLAIAFAGPFVSFQDAGRFGHLRFGVPASGPMDRLSYVAANAALGNPAGTTAIEISMGGLILECRTGTVSIAITGGNFSVDHAGAKGASWQVLTLSPGEKLTIRPGTWGSWAYVAFAGAPLVPDWLGHTATHAISGFGGGPLTAGQTLTIRDAETREGRVGDILQPGFAKPTGTAHIVMGPQDRHFVPDAIAAIGSATYHLTDAYDRMGVRLDGPPLTLAGALSIPSEPIIRGAVQVAGDAVPTVLLADHGTTGGYPKIATVISSDLDAFTQMRARDPVRFRPIQPAEAVSRARTHAATVAAYLDSIARPRGTLLQRLMSENLISGVVSTHD